MLTLWAAGAAVNVSLSIRTFLQTQEGKFKRANSNGAKEKGALPPPENSSHRPLAFQSRPGDGLPTSTSSVFIAVHHKSGFLRRQAISVGNMLQ
jgi:hypothetical protein